MKRKALITATAVLLVAVMCLATASYAWFTAGDVSKVTGLQLSVGGSDGALQLAPAQMGNGYVAGAYKSTLDLSTDWPAHTTEADRWAVMPKDNTLTAVSTADGVNFFPAKYENNVWTAQEATKDGYLLVSFWVKAAAAGTATMTFNFPGATATFNQATKLGIAVNTAAPESGKHPTLTTYDLLADVSETPDLYRPVSAAGAVSKKDVNNRFVPNDATATGFADARTAQQEFVKEEITFTASGETKLVTVAIWLEGMDEQCQGNWTATNTDKFSIDFAWAKA